MSYYIKTTDKLNELIEYLTKKKLLYLNVEDINPEGKNKIIINPKGAIKNTTTDAIKNLIEDKFNGQIKFEFEFNNDHISVIKFEDLTVDRNGDIIKQIERKKDLKEENNGFILDKLIYIIIFITLIYVVAV